MFYKLHDLNLWRQESSIRVDYSISKSESDGGPWEIVKSHSTSIRLTTKVGEIVKAILSSAQKIAKTNALEQDIIGEVKSILEGRVVEL